MITPSARAWPTVGIAAGSASRAIAIPWGDRLALLLQLHVTYADGRTVVIASDEQWQATTGPIPHGRHLQRRDLRRPAWSTPAGTRRPTRRAPGRGVRKLDHGMEMLEAQVGPFVRRHEELATLQVIHTPKGETVYDFGQNLVGWVRLNAHRAGGLDDHPAPRRSAGPTGQLLHREPARRAPDCELYPEGERFRNVRAAFHLHGVSATWQWDATDGTEVESLTGVAVYSDMPSTGTFECSNPLINQLQHNIVWGAAGQLRRRADRLPAARRAPRLGRAMRRCSSVRPVSTAMSRRSSPNGSPTWRPTKCPMGPCRWCCPT